MMVMAGEAEREWEFGTETSREGAEEESVRDMVELRMRNWAIAFVFVVAVVVVVVVVVFEVGVWFLRWLLRPSTLFTIWRISQEPQLELCVRRPERKLEAGKMEQFDIDAGGTLSDGRN